ncbi:MAG: WYL domain-containing protein [Bacteroidales bacterium]|nr:WYL domain-containing protein [Bacteroidales bacterium]
MNNISNIDFYLRIVRLLSNGRRHHRDTICEIFDISRRKFDRTISDLREVGFDIPRPKEGYYYIDRRNSRSELQELVYITNEELAILAEAIEAIDETNTLKQDLRKKLRSLIDVDLITQSILHPRRARIVKTLGEAIQHHEQVIIERYRSGHSNEIRDRKVEPISLSANMQMLCAYDIEDRIPKQYKITRMRDVQNLHKPAQYEAYHKELRTDPFRISGTAGKKIRFTMSLLAYNLLMEEYPLAAEFTTENAPGVWAFEGEVFLYEGVGRFILSLPGEITLLADNGLKAYIKAMIKKFG